MTEVKKLAIGITSALVKSMRKPCIRLFDKFYFKKYKCVICNKKIKKFLRTGNDFMVFKKLSVISGGIRENSVCPKCGSLERHRLEYMYICRETDILQGKCKILHFAPEELFMQIFSNRDNIDYFTADIVKGRAMCEVDITNIPFGSNEFDYVICNHVLEHIPNEAKALAEIKRVLVLGGRALLMVPIALACETTIEKDNITTDQERIDYYGQSDHVRLYGRDFHKQLEKANFKVEMYIAKENFNKEALKKFALIPDETVYIAINE